MKNKIHRSTTIGLLLGLTAITALCTVSPVCAGTGSAPGKSKPSHGGGSGGGPVSGTFYPTVTNFSQLIDDINYADKAGGTFTINLQPNTTFNLVTNYTCGGVGCNLLPIIGGTNAVNLSIIGNGSTIQRDATNGNAYQVRLFEVARGSSLTLDHITLKNGYSWAYNGGAIYNSGTLTINNCTLSANTAHYSGYIATLLGGKGGAIYNNGGTALINNSILSDNFATGQYVYGGAIYNESGTVTISHSVVSGDYALSGVTDDSATISAGGGIYNQSGTVTIENSSTISSNGAWVGADVDNGGALYLDGTSAIGILDGTSAIPF